MSWFMGWIALSILAGVIAGNKGRSSLGFFCLSIIFSPLIGIIAALIAKPDIKEVEQNKINSGERKKCPFCAELIKYEAIVCRFCGRDLPEENYKVSDIKDRAIRTWKCLKCGELVETSSTVCWNCLSQRKNS